jgi:predicted AAA+ superfamily ATPase
MLEKFKKHNLWGAKATIFQGYYRKFYGEKIKSILGSHLIKVLQGQRRVGKSYILRQTMHYLVTEMGVSKSNIFYLNKEHADFSHIKTAEHLYEAVNEYKQVIQPKGKVYYFFDEIQEIHEFETIITSLAMDDIDPAEVFITGSNAHLLSSELTTLLTGRFIAFEVFPFSYTEYCESQHQPKTKQTFLQYLKTGGLPGLFELNEVAKRDYSSLLVNTILFKDIVQKYSIKNAQLLSDLFLFLIDNTGNIFSKKSIVDTLKSKGISAHQDTIAQYLRYLEEVYLLHPAQHYDIQGKKYLSRPHKYYINDIGLRTYMRSSFDFGLGKQLENHMYLYYKRLGYKVYVGKYGSREIDFIVENATAKKYTQVCYTLDSEKTIQREFGNLESIHDHYPKQVISLDDVSFGNKNGIEHVLAWGIEGI